MTMMTMVMMLMMAAIMLTMIIIDAHNVTHHDRTIVVLCAGDLV